MDGFPLRAQLLTVCVVLTNVAGNALLSSGVKNAAGVPALLKNPAFLLGVSLLALWTVSRTALMSWADLSYVLPVTAIGYVLTTAAGAFFLQEQVSTMRWAATVLIVAGTVLAGTTHPKTVPERHE
jgi:drug/metabolite transporter (DMT)-like permease